jgi:hypothetical protein
MCYVEGVDVGNVPMECEDAIDGILLEQDLYDFARRNLNQATNLGWSQSRALLRGHCFRRRNEPPPSVTR